MKRVITYIDGFNLYFGLRSKGWKRFYRLNVQKMAQQLLKPDQALIIVKYFTSIGRQPFDKHGRQALYLEALGTLTDLQILYGHYLSELVTCRNCGYSYQTYHEKMTDVNIAVELLTDAFQDRMDVVMLISAEGDLVGPIRTVRRLFDKKRLVVAFPPGRSSKALRQAAHGSFTIGHNVLLKSVFPDQVIKPGGFVLNRPDKWR